MIKHNHVLAVRKDVIFCQRQYNARAAVIRRCYVRLPHKAWPDIAFWPNSNKWRDGATSSLFCIIVAIEYCSCVFPFSRRDSILEASRTIRRFT